MPWILALLLLSTPAAAADVDVLLVGNSYTGFNDLAGALEAALEVHPDIADARVIASSPGGWRLPQHLAEADGTNGVTQLSNWMTLDPTGWHAIVFQDQSQVPGFFDLDPIYAESRDAFVELDRMTAAAPGGPETVLFVTWGRRDGDDTNPGLFPDFTAMQARLDAGYRGYAAAADRTVYLSPVGTAWANVHGAIVAAGNDPTQEGSCFHRLYNGDGSHPSAEGTWVIASTLAQTLVGAVPPELADSCGAMWAEAATDAAASEVLPDLFAVGDDDDAANDDDSAGDDDDSAGDDDGAGPETQPFGERDTAGCGCGGGSALVLVPLFGFLSRRSRG